MITVRPIMNSCAEDVLAFKTCCSLKMFEQNLEIILENNGENTVVIQGYFDLVGDYGKKRITNLVPPGEIVVESNDCIACYCNMDEELWNRSQRIRFYNRNGAAYETIIRGHSAAKL